MAKFTPGPWSYDDDGEASRVREQSGGSVCTLNWLRKKHAGPRRDSTEVYSNGILIAAAPEMYELLQRFTEPGYSVALHMRDALRLLDRIDEESDE